MPRSWTSPGTAFMIRDFFRIVGESWAKRVHNELTVWCESRGYTPPSYKSIRNFFYALRRLGLIEKVRTEPVPGHPTAFPRAIYQLVPGTADDPRWRNPLDACFNPTRYAEKTSFRIDVTSPEDWMERIRLLKGRTTAPLF